MSRNVWASFAGEGLVTERVGYEIEHVEHGDGEAFAVEVTLDLGGLSITLDFPSEVAEEFLVDLRGEIVRCKEARLGWETDTDPESGVTDDEGGEP